MKAGVKRCFFRNRGSRLGSLLLAGVAVSHLWNCASVPELKSAQVVRGRPRLAPRETLDAIDGANEIAEAYYRAVEWPRHVDPEEGPGLAVSLSGGGVRSATFSLGVLTGLHELGLFPGKTDLLSAVSGGGYAATWFYGQQVLNGLSPESLLTPAGETPAGEKTPDGPQERLREDAEVIQLLKKPNGIVYGVLSIGQGLVLNAVANGLLGLHANTTPARQYYEDRIAEVFLKPRGSVSWPEVHQLILEQERRGEHLPNLILNASVAFGTGSHPAKRAGYNAIYEFTPQRFGSDGMGYYCVEGAQAEHCTSHHDPANALTLERSASISGAAYDSSRIERLVPGHGARIVVSALNLDLGFWIENPEQEKKRCWMRALPLVYVFTNAYRKDTRGCKILLTDGGHAENLGLYSLARRSPRMIVAVDAAQDPKQEFADYRQLRELLLTDLDFVASVPELEEGRLDVGPAYFGEIITSTLESSGEINPSTGEDRERTISLVYIKVPPRSQVDIKCEAQVLEKSICDYAKKHKSFPHSPTLTDQAFDPAQFEAYRGLGLAIVRDASKRICEVSASHGLGCKALH